MVIMIACFDCNLHLVKYNHYLKFHENKNPERHNTKFNTLFLMTELWWYKRTASDHMILIMIAEIQK